MNYSKIMINISANERDFEIAIIASKLQISYITQLLWHVIRRVPVTRDISALQESVVTISPKSVPQSLSAKDDVS